jgi:hypothetical protein
MSDIMGYRYLHVDESKITIRTGNKLANTKAYNAPVKHFILYFRYTVMYPQSIGGGTVMVAREACFAKRQPINKLFLNFFSYGALSKTVKFSE